MDLSRIVLLLTVIAALTGCLGVFDALDDASSRPAGAPPSFVERSADVGVDFVQSRPPEGLTNGLVVGGLYVGDVDGDHRPDLLALDNTHAVLYLNAGGSFHRRNLSVPGEGSLRSALFFDYDADGDEDLLVLRATEMVLLRNDGGSFVPVDVGLGDGYLSLRGASAADRDGDGCLDLLVYQDGGWLDRRPRGYSSLNVSVTNDNGGRNLLFDGDCGSFDHVEGAFETTTWTLAASFVDLTGDGHPDVHTANDFNNDVLFVNRGNGSFARRVLPDSTNRNGMSSEITDVNRDGRPDIFVSNIYTPNVTGNIARRIGERYSGNNLLVNQGDGVFRDRARAYDVWNGSFGWAAVMEDMDNDGDDDLYQAITVFDNTYAYDPDDSFENTNNFWIRRGDGFEKASVGELTTREFSSYGAATLDYDLDGTMDLVVSNVSGHGGGQYRLYDNAEPEDQWLQIALEDASDPELGSTVTVRTANTTQTEVVNARADYQSQDTRTVHVGLRAAEHADVVVRWPDGASSRWESVAADQRIVLHRDGQVEVVRGATAD